MDTWRQLESVAKNRWCGAYWQNHGLLVVPTISWAGATSFKFSFDGVEKGSVVAVGTIGCRQGKIAFMRGYQKMLETIEPEAVICFGKPFDEMNGNVLVIDYLNSRKAVR